MNLKLLNSKYHLTIRQQPKQSRMCGIGEKGIGKKNKQTNKQRRTVRNNTML